MPSEMTSRERWIATVRGDPADRVPIAAPIRWNPRWRVAAPELSGWQAKPNYRRVLDLVLQYCDDPVCPVAVGGFFDRRFLLIPNEYISYSLNQRDDATVFTYVVHTPKGELRTVEKLEPGVTTVWVIEPLLKDETDVARLLSVPFRRGEFDFQRYFDEAKSVGENAPMELPVGDPMVGISRMFDFAQFLEWCMSKPAFIERLIAIRFERTYERLEYLLENGVTCSFLLGGSEQATPPMMSPKLFDAFVMKYDSRLIDLIHRYGGLAHVHCHGRVKEAIPKFIEMGADALDPVEPPPQGDIELAEAKRICAGRMTLMGNIEFRDLGLATPSEINEKVKRALADGGKERLILFPSARPISTPTDRFLANAIQYVESGLKYGKLQLCREHSKG